MSNCRVPKDLFTPGPPESPGGQRPLTSTSLCSVCILISGNKNAAAKKNTNAIPLSSIRKIREETEKGKQVDGIVISQGELERIKRSTRVQTKEQASESQKLMAAQQDQRAAALARKKRM